MLDTGNSRSQTGLTLLSSLLALAVPALGLGAAAEAAAAGAVDEEAAPAGGDAGQGKERDARVCQNGKRTQRHEWRHFA